jgi:hypothetical protein
MRPLSFASVRAWRGLTALVIAAVALWCTRGLLDIVSGPAGGVMRVAMLPPWWLLAILVVVLGAGGLAASRAGADPDIALPLCASGVLVLPYLPWLPDRLPVLRAAAGPARFLVWPIVFWLIACRDTFGLWRRLRPVVSPLVIFLASAIAFGAVASRLTDTPLFPGGDEPHYLVITQSLLHDRDLKIENNHRREDYRAYYNGALKPDYLALGKDGQIYSIHPVGLPVLAMPAFAVAGYHGVVAMLIVMAALAATLLWRWARDTTGSAGAATFAWAATALTAPFLFNSFTVYPEVPAALAVIAAIGWRPESASIGMMLFRGMAIATLPWLSTKYAPMAAAVTIVALLRGGWNRRAATALLAPIGIALGAWFGFFVWIWGSPSPSAPYGLSEPTTWRHLVHGGPGLIFDQEYGIVATAPVLAIAFAGVVQMLRSGGAAARRATELTFIFGALLCTVGAFHIWWGGEASAGRPVTSGLLLFGLPIASFFASTATRRPARAGCHLLLVSSLAIAVTLVAVQGGALVHQDRDGSAVFLAWASPTWPLASAFPTFLTGSVVAAVWRTAVWLALGALVLWGAQLLSASHGPASAFAATRLRRDKKAGSYVPNTSQHEFGRAALAILGLGFVAAVAFVSLATRSTTLPAEMVPDMRARVPLLDGFDRSRRPTALLYDPLSRVSSADALSHVLLVARPGLRTAPQPIELLWNARFALPAGAYRLRLTRSDTTAADSMVSLQIGRTGPPLDTWKVAGAAWEHQFVLPIDAALVGFRARPDLANANAELQLTATSVVDESRRIARPPVIGTRRYGRATAFFHDDQVFAESAGYWMRGRTTAQVTYVTSAESPGTIDIMASCGPVPNQVTFSTPEWRQHVTIEPGAPRRVSIPVGDVSGLGVRVAPIAIEVEKGFVPAAADPAATDRRFLGCWIEHRWDAR